MAAIPKAFVRILIFCFAIFCTCALKLIFCNQDSVFRVHNVKVPFQLPLDLGETMVPKNIASRLDLTEQQCRAAFPGLTEDIDENIKKGKFVFGKSDADYKGLIQGRIKDNKVRSSLPPLSIPSYLKKLTTLQKKLYILTTAPDTTSEILFQRSAVLQQIQRALTTAPDHLPDTHFTFVINDSPKNNSWSFAKPNKNSNYNVWLMPHFSFWSWPSSDPPLGTIDDILTRITNVEKEGPWVQKIDRAVWRGTPWFNPLGYPLLRQALLKAAKDKEWADVAALNRTASGAYANSLRIEDFCRYKYVVYTEGVTYSGRLPYHQACESVLLMAPLTYLTHTAYSIRPVVADELLSVFSSSSSSASVGSSAKKTGYVQPLLPTIPASEWHTANAIYVRPDFSNLESTIFFLRSHPEVAARIARNQRDVVVEGQYLSSAAEVCYWRSLVRGWAKSAVVDEAQWGSEMGERFENWILEEVTSERRRGRKRRAAAVIGPGG